MAEDNKAPETHPEFEPLQILGWFWIGFGLIILVGTFFIEGSDLVPRSHGVLTNLVASSVILGVGLWSLRRGRRNARRIRLGKTDADAERSSDSPSDKDNPL